MPEVEVSQGATSPRRHVADVLFDAASRMASSRAVESGIEELPALSLYAFVTSIMTLGGRIVQMGKFELGVAEIMSWQKPAMTLTMLFGYTTVCYYPQWLVMLPLFYFTLFVLVPNYASKFKIENNTDLTLLADPLLDAVDKDEEKRKQARSLLTAIKQGQKSLTKIVAALDKLDEFRNGPAKFADAQVSSIMLISALTVLLSTTYFLTFASIPFFFTMIGWGVVLSKHPLAKLTSEKLEDLYLEPSVDIKAVLAKIIDFCHKNVLIDEEPLQRIVEIYELQPQGLTARLWDAAETIYSSKPYVLGSRSRIRLPEGSTDISQILPPEGWYFDLGDAWEVDTKPELWTSVNAVTQVEIKDCWVYDIPNEETIWRRRRRTRVCYYDLK